MKLYLSDGAGSVSLLGPLNCRQCGGPLVLRGGTEDRIHITWVMRQDSEEQEVTAVWCAACIRDFEEAIS